MDRINLTPAEEDRVNAELQTKQVEFAQKVRDRIPADGLFADLTWRISPAPLSLGGEQAEELETLGRVLMQFYKASNLLYRMSVAGREPAWVAALLDQGKPAWLIEVQRHAALKMEMPRVIRPDLLMTENGLILTELDSVPGGIGLTAWLNQTYAELSKESPECGWEILGGATGMLDGFAGIFGRASQVHIVVSEEAATYRPEMQWMAKTMGADRFHVRNSQFTDFQNGDAVYRFFELFDTENVANARLLFEKACAREIQLTPPPRPLFEEKLLLGLLWNKHLYDFWRRELGEAYLIRLQALVPRTWIMDPTPLPPHAAIPGLELTGWPELKRLSQKQRDLILKISGFSEKAWGARGVHLGSDLSQQEWSAVVDEALATFSQSPSILQQFHKPRRIPIPWVENGQVQTMDGRVRLCPYYFLAGNGDAVRAKLGGVLATACPGDKKIIHGMSDAVLTPCCV